MNNAHPLLRIAQNRKGVLIDACTSSTDLVCTTCLRPITINHEGDILHTHTSDHEACTPSVLVTVTKAIIQCLEEEKRLFVKPVRRGCKTLAPDLIFAQSSSLVRPFINMKYQPVGASWKSEKGYRLGLFFLPERAAGIKKDGFDFIAVIDPVRFIAEFDQAWALNTMASPMEFLCQLLCSTNASSEWVQWPVKSKQPEKEMYSTSNWCDYYGRDPIKTPEKVCVASVAGIEGNDSGETIYVLQVALQGILSDYKIVRSLGCTLLLDNTGNAVSAEFRDYALIRKTCIEAVRSFVRQNQLMQTPQRRLTIPV